MSEEFSVSRIYEWKNSVFLEFKSQSCITRENSMYSFNIFINNSIYSAPDESVVGLPHTIKKQICSAM